MAPDSHAGRVGTGARRPPLFPELVLVAGEAPPKGLHARAVRRLLPKMMFLRGPISMVKMMAEGRSDHFHVPSYLGRNAYTGRHEASALTRERRPSAAPLALSWGLFSRFPSQPRGGAELRWHLCLPGAHQPWHVSHVHRPSVFQGPRSARSCWPPAWGPRVRWGHPGSVAIGVGQSYLIRALFLPRRPPDYLLICCCIQLTSCAFSGSCWSGF